MNESEQEQLVGDLNYWIGVIGNRIGRDERRFDDVVRKAIAALRASAPQEDGRALEPVAWRWRHVNSASRDWNYQDQPIGNHNEYLQVEPLYPPSQADKHEHNEAALRNIVAERDAARAAMASGGKVERKVPDDAAPPSVALEAPYRWNMESNARHEVKVRDYVDNLRFAIASEIEAKCNAQTDDYYTIGCSVLEIPMMESLVKFAIRALTRLQPGGAVAGTERGGIDG
jgi:hypothetical protein